jgi:hypothetical protein
MYSFTVCSSAPDCDASVESSPRLSFEVLPATPERANSDNSSESLSLVQGNRKHFSNPSTVLYRRHHQRVRKKCNKRKEQPKRTYCQMACRWFKSKVGPQDWEEEHFNIGGTKRCATSVDEKDRSVANLLRRKEQKGAVFIEQRCSPDNPNNRVGDSINGGKESHTTNLLAVPILQGSGASVHQNRARQKPHIHQCGKAN